ncbi:exocyst complex component EXO70A1-like [Olea europaea subsp. europaea]|uniref:Exocyst subunit Exo70 family protein n=1 Tax=Olea europaea subsp. europaea TaxID=158383 RepID=A0A8S0TC76_OLEEU|nr:exocyst complex component EXO70A1-like [Olea europaea subsp. europaea]
MNGRVSDDLESKAMARLKHDFQTVLKRLRFMELSIGRDAERFQWDDLKMKIELWIQVAKVCFYKLFDMEKQICGQIFEGFGVESIEECFVEIVTDPANNLLIFAETVSLKAIRTGAKGLVFRLEDDVRRMLSDFEKSVFHELSPIPEDRGAIHPLTEKVIDYINLTLSHKKLLTNWINSMPPLKFGDQMIPEEELGDLNGRSHFELHLILIIVALQLNLKGKSEQY